MSRTLGADDAPQRGAWMVLCALLGLVAAGLFRVLGKRSLAQLPAFDLIQFLVISEALQNALLNEDNSVVMGRPSSWPSCCWTAACRP